MQATAQRGACARRPAAGRLARGPPHSQAGPSGSPTPARPCSTHTPSPTWSRASTLPPPRAAAADAPAPASTSAAQEDFIGGGRDLLTIADAGSRGARDVLELSDYESDDGDISSSLKRLDVPYAVIELADELYARLVETDVSTAEGPGKLAAALFSVLPPPGVGSGPLARPPGEAGPPLPLSTRVVPTPGMPIGAGTSFHDLDSLGERDLLAMLRRLGRQGGAPVALALHELLDAADAGYATRTRGMFAVLMHVAMLNGDGDAVDEAWDKMVAAGIAPDDEAYNQAISTHAKGRRMDRASELIAAARAAGARLDGHTYSTFLSALERSVPYYDGFEPVSLPPPAAAGAAAGAAASPPWMTPAGFTAVERVREIWADMRDAGTCRPTTFTHRAIVAALARAGDLDGAEAAALEQGGDGGLPGAVVTSALVHGCIWVGAWDRARTALGLLAAAAPAAAAGGTDPARLVSDAIRAGGPEGFAFALDAARVLRPLYWAPGTLVAGPRAMATAEEKAATAAAGALRGGGGGGGEKASRGPSSSSSASRPSLLRLLAAAHDLARADDALEVGRWIAEEGWRPEARAVGLLARTLAAAGRPAQAASYLRSTRAPQLDARFGPALVGLEAAAAAAEEEGDDEGAAAIVERVLDGPLAPFAPPPGWHAARTGSATQAIVPPTSPASASFGRGQAPLPAASSAPRRLAPRAPRYGGGSGGGGGGGEGGQRAPAPWG